MDKQTKAFFALLSIVAVAALVIGIVAIVQVNNKSDETTEAPQTTTEYTGSTTPIDSTTVPSQPTTTTESPPGYDQDFAPDFEFGAATSAYQIEGAWNVDGKGPNIWDIAVHDHPEIIRGNATGNDAADSYYHYKEDVKALKASGVSIFFHVNIL